LRLRRAQLPIVLILALALSACGTLGSGEDSPPAPPREFQFQQNPPQGNEVYDLKSVCPNPVVIQTDWNPEAEYGATYNLIGDGYKVDTKRGLTRGPLVVDGKHTGIDVEVRLGGPQVKFTPVAELMHKDKGITLGYMNTDQVAGFHAKWPTISVVAPMELSPFGFFWDQGENPAWNTMVDIGATTAPILYATQVQVQMEFLVGSGIIKRSQIKKTYTGDPSQFIQAQGKIVSQGFATAEPWLYENVFRYPRPIGFALLADSGYDAYSQTLAIRTGDKDQLAPCLRRLVPLVQRSIAQYATQPERTNQLIVDLVQRYNNGWSYPAPLADFSIQQQRQLGITDNGKDGRTVGEFDMARVDKILGILQPIYAGVLNQDLPADLGPEDLATNEFIDSAIAIPAGGQ
jgi:hypothetical protein